MLADFAETALAVNSVATRVKRSSGCTQNSTYITTPASIFSVSCNSIWAWWDALYITFTPDFETCMDACAAWNAQTQETCVGASWTDGTYGPSGVTGGSECTFYWVTTTSFQSNGTDSAQLENVETPTVLPPVRLRGLLVPDNQLSDEYASCSATHRDGLCISEYDRICHEWRQIRSLLRHQLVWV
jgi:hypothetical protein